MIEETAVIEGDGDEPDAKWYRKALDDNWELSQDDQAIVDRDFQAKGIPEDMTAYVCEVDGSPTLYLKLPNASLAMAIGAIPCEEPKKRKLTPYRNTRENLEIP